MTGLKNFFVVLFLAVFILPIFSGPGQDRGSATTITATYATGNELTANLMRERIMGFQRANPNVRIVERLSNEGAYLDSLRTLDAVGEFPDLIEMRDTPLFVRAGRLGELPRDIVNLFEITVPFNGRVYTAPIDESYPTGIIYSRRIFNQLGIRAENIRTYQDFLAACERIRASGVAPIVIGGADIWHIGFWWGFFWQNEVAVRHPDWIARRYANQVRFTDPEIRAVITGLNELFQRGFIERGWASTSEGLAPSILVSGQAAMYYIGPFAFNQITEADPNFDFGFFALPDRNGRINAMGGPTAAGWAINADTQRTDPAKTEAVYNFIRYFFRNDNYSEFLRVGNFLPSTRARPNYPTTPLFQEVLRIASTADNKQLNWNQKIGNDELPPNFRNYCYRLVGELFLNQTTVDEVLRAMDREWEVATRDFNPVLNP